MPLQPGESVHLPGPSIFPLMLALGLSVFLLGLVAGPIELRLMISLLGIVYLITAGAGWAVETYRERQRLEASALHVGPDAAQE